MSEKSKVNPKFWRKVGFIMFQTPGKVRENLGKERWSTVQKFSSL